MFLCALVALPFVVAISKDKGRFTWGDTAGIAYAKMVNGVEPYVYWQGGPPGAGIPKHPVRKILAEPPVYEYAKPVGGTYPLWTDNSYWYDGVRPHFEFRQFNVIHINLHAYYDVFFVPLGFLIAIFLILVLSSSSVRALLQAFSDQTILWLPALGGLTLYVIVAVVGRYLSGLVILLCTAGFSVLRCSPLKTSRTTMRITVWVAIFMLWIQILMSVGHTSTQLFSHNFPDWAVATKLRQIGVPPDGKVSFIGYALVDHLWAHLAGVTIMSEVPAAGVISFWAAAPERKAEVFRLFSQSGATAVVTTNVPTEALSQGWQAVTNTSYYVLPLSEK